jgi:spore coat polysaccharide biosynthesis protein SpsF (cytidylyltransferase family)
MIRAFIQARMSSARFPGKVLAPLHGKPVIQHVIERVERVIPPKWITVVTSAEEADDPLACYVQRKGIAVFRGPLDDVFGRFRMCLMEFPCEWVLRVNADSPMLSVENMRSVIAYEKETAVDLVTTTFPRTFPKGQNAELIRVDTFMRIEATELTAEDREHVTAFYYRQPRRFRIANVFSGNPPLAELNYAVDTLDDLRELEKILKAEIPQAAEASQNGIASCLRNSE